LKTIFTHEKDKTNEMKTKFVFGFLIFRIVPVFREQIFLL